MGVATIQNDAVTVEKARLQRRQHPIDLFEGGVGKPPDRFALNGVFVEPHSPHLLLTCLLPTYALCVYILNSTIYEGCRRLTYAAAYAKMPTMVERYVKLFKNGRNQAVRIPREFELPGQSAIIRKEGPRLIIEAVPPRSLLAVLKTLVPLDEQFPPIQDPPAEPLDL